MNNNAESCCVFLSDDQIVSHLMTSLVNAEKNTSKLNNVDVLSAGIINLFGMSGRKTRHLINNLASVPLLRYGEVGSYLGSTLLSAMYGNQITATCCDNWTQFGGPSSEFKNNLRAFFSSQATQRLNIIEGDFKDKATIDVEHWKNTDFYFFDGPHDEESQYLGITSYFNNLSDRFLLMVDDWHWSEPRAGTLRALNELPLTILRSIEIHVENEILDHNGIITNRFQNSDYHNGIAVFACKKL